MIALTLHLSLFILFIVMSYRVASGVIREAVVLREFNQSRTLAFVVLLFPLGPVILLAGSYFLPFPIAYIAAAACYVPALAFSHLYGRALETAGTDRVQKAQASISQAFGTALVGIIYVGVHFGITAIASGID